MNDLVRKKHLMDSTAIRGSGSMKGGSPTEDATSVRSNAIAKIIDVISEGPCRGLVRAARGILLDDTQVRTDSGKENFDGFKYTQRVGTEDQEYVKGFETTATETQVTTKVVFGVPVVRDIPDTEIDSISVRVRIPGLYEADDEGNIKATKLQYAIEWAPLGSSIWRHIPGSPFELDDKTNSNYYRSYDFVPSEFPVSVRVRRISPDTDSAKKTNDLYFDAYSTIIEGKFTYPNVAYIAGEINAEQFGQNIPKRTYHYRGRLIRVPVNYDATTREYTGFWDGRFKVSFTNNPAWIFLDLCTNKRYGLGLPDSALSLGDLYQIAQYCDEFVPTGQGPEHGPAILNAQFDDGIAGSWQDDETPEGTSWTTEGGQAKALGVGATNDKVALLYRNVSCTEGKRYRVTANVSGGMRWMAGTMPGGDDLIEETTADSGYFQAVSTNAYITLASDRLSGRADNIQVREWRREPRFTMNFVLRTREQAYEVLQTIASSFNAMIYWGAGQVILSQDRPREVDYIVTRANVVNGVFDYQDTSNMSRKNVVYVAWDNPAMNGGRDIEAVSYDQDVIINGYNAEEITAFGCTSRSQAHRTGEWYLYTQHHDTELVTYVAGQDHADVMPGQIIGVADPLKSSEFCTGGRVKSKSGTTIVLDRVVNFEAGKSYRMLTVTEDKEIVERVLVSPGGVDTDTISVTAGISGEIADHMFIIYDAAVGVRKYRVTTVSENDDGTYTVKALLHNPTKYNFIDREKLLGEAPTNIFTEGDLPAPSLLTITKSLSSVPGTAYQVQYLASWPPVTGDNRVLGYQLQLNDNANSDAWRTIFEGRESSYVYVTNQGTTPIRFRVRTVGKGNITSDWTYSTSQTPVKGPADAPPPPEEPTDGRPSYETGQRKIIIRWSLADFPDYQYTEIWRNTTNDLPTATLRARVVGTEFTDDNLQLINYYYWFRHRSYGLDGEDYYSEFSGPYIYQPSPQSVDSIPPGFVTTLEMADSAITADKIANGAIEAGKIAAGAVTAGKIAAAAVTTTNIVDGAIEEAKLASAAVTAFKISDGAVEAAKLATNSVGSTKIQDDAVTTQKVAANAIVAGKIAANQIGTNHLVAEAVTAEKIAANAIIAGKIAAGAVTAGTIAANAVTATAIEAGAVSAVKIAAGAIVASKLYVSDTENLFPDYDMADQAFYTPGSGVVPTFAATSNAYMSKFKMTIPTGAGDREVVSNSFSVVPSVEHLFQGVARNNAGGNCRIIARLYTLDGSGNEVLSRNITLINSSADAVQSVAFTTNSTERRMRLVFVNASGSSGSAEFSAPMVRRKMYGQLIVDGEIAANHIAVGSITANKIQAGTITLDRMIVGSFHNQAADPDFELDGTGWGNPGGTPPEITFVVSGAAFSGAKIALITYAGSSATFGTENTHWIRCREGDRFYAATYARNYSGYVGTGMRCYIRWRDKDGNSLGASVSPYVTSGTWTLTSIVGDAPANAYYAQIAIQSVGQTAGQGAFDNVLFVKMTDGVTIVDGTIATNHVADEAITQVASSYSSSYSSAKTDGTVLNTISVTSLGGPIVLMTSMWLSASYSTTYNRFEVYGYKIQYSLNNSTWTDIDTVQVDRPPAGFSSQTTYAFNFRHTPTGTIGQTVWYRLVRYYDEPATPPGGAVGTSTLALQNRFIMAMVIKK